MNIRPYLATDYEAIKAILQSGDLFDDAWDAPSHLNQKIAKDPTSILVAEEENEVTGCILIIRDNWTPFLFRLAVKESYRKKGVGTALMQAAEEQLRNEGMDEVAIFVDEEKTDLQKYYEKRGYIRGGNYRCMYKKLQA